jgi:UDP-N-acetylmuramate: L-alanyl-gamma-D-glutamyl-meso-diaminopimelate ligase
MPHAHLLGIGGTGMSALAGLLVESGWRVSGSDQAIYPPVDAILAELKVEISQGYRVEDLPISADLYVIGNVVARGNPQAEQILNQDLPYLSMAEALYRHAIAGHESCVIAGAHGKTTITSMVAHILHRAGRDPGLFVGGKPANFAANHRLGRGRYFVSEGDEYETAFFDRSSKFLHYHPRYLILTSLEYDHLDVFPSEALYLKSFQNLVNQVPGEGLIVVHQDFPMGMQAVAKAHTPVVSYGERGGDVRVQDIAQSSAGLAFTLRGDGWDRRLTLGIGGRYNAHNAAAAAILTSRLGIPEEIIEKALASFAGVERRLQLLARRGRIAYYEDFAHHPTAIASVLASLREGNPGCYLVAAFEPRSWSLRRNFFQTPLACSLALADEIVLQDVYEKEKIPESERLDVDRLAAELAAAGKKVVRSQTADDVWTAVTALNPDRPAVAVLLSNGSFGGLPARLRELA